MEQLSEAELITPIEVTAKYNSFEWGRILWDARHRNAKFWIDKIAIGAIILSGTYLFITGLMILSSPSHSLKSPHLPRRQM
jgi:hypothetical protein